MQNHAYILRWLLVVPAAVAAWYSVFVVGIFAHGYVEETLCPAGEMVSGICTNRDVQRILKVVVHAFVALSAAAVESAAVAIAPSHRNGTAWIVFAVGAVVAVVFGVATAAYTEAVAAILSGLLTAIAIIRYLRSSSHLSSRGD